MPEDRKPGTICVSPENIDKAPIGWIVAKAERGRLVLIDPSTITKAAEDKADKALEAVSRFDAFTRHVKHFKTLCKSHFVNAFTLFKTKVMEGEVEIKDESALALCDQVLSGEKKVSEALNANDDLKAIFVSIYGEYDENEEADGDTKAFPEV